MRGAPRDDARGGAARGLRSYGVPVAFAVRSPEPFVYARRHPERTALYEVVRDNLETLYGAIAEGALDVRLAKHQKQELEAYLDCGLLCRGFARLRCGACKESASSPFPARVVDSARRASAGGCARPPPTSLNEYCPRSRCGNGC
jgi:hypothetical protein